MSLANSVHREPTAQENVKKNLNVLAIKWSHSESSLQNCISESYTKVSGYCKNRRYLCILRKVCLVKVFLYSIVTYQYSYKPTSTTMLMVYFQGTES